MVRKKRMKKSFLESIPNRLGYTLIVILFIVLLGIGVYAWTPGQIPNPGHNLNMIGPPSPCTSGQVITYDGVNLVCQSPAIPEESIQCPVKGTPVKSEAGITGFLRYDTCTVSGGNVVFTSPRFIYTYESGSYYLENVYRIGWATGCTDQICNAQNEAEDICNAYGLTYISHSTSSGSGAACYYDNRDSWRAYVCGSGYANNGGYLNSVTCSKGFVGVR